MNGRIAVIGGGVAGCSAAWHLTQRGVQVVLFEAASQLGGRATTSRTDGVTIDTGAGFICNFYPEVLATLDTLGLRGDVVPLAPTSGFLKDGQLGTMTLGSIGSFLRFPFLGWRDKARFAAEMGKRTLQRRRYDLHDPHILAPYDTEDMATASIRELGESIYHHGIRPGVEPFWFFRCEDASQAMLLALCSRVVEGGIVGLRGGMDTLATALARDADVRLDSPVRSVGPGSVVDGEAFEGVVVALPGSGALRVADAVLTPDQRAFYRGLRYIPQVHVGFVVESGWPDGCAVLIPIGPGEHDIGILSLQTPKHGAPKPGHDLVSVFLSGAASARLIDHSDDEIIGKVWQMARAERPEFPASAQSVGVWRRREALPVPVPGHYRRASAFLRTQQPPVVFAGDHFSTPNLEGALLSGRWAAQALL